MMNSESDSRLKEIAIEDFIWVIYLGIILFSFISNDYEKKYILYKNEEDKKKYREIIIVIFSILVIVYGYFLIDAYNGVKSLKQSDTDKKKLLVTLSFIASFLIFISGIIFLYIAYKDEDLDVELAFN